MKRLLTWLVLLGALLPGVAQAKLKVVTTTSDLADAVRQVGGDRVEVTAIDPPEVARLVRTTLDHFGRIDVWVNNAGRGISMPVSQVTDDDFDTMMLVNTKSALYGMQAVLPHFKERGDGHIINVSSLLGRVPVAHVRSAYNAAKHALNALTGSLRIELQQDYPGIQVSTVSPGVVATEFGVRALGGGMDSRQMPNAQPVTEVAEVIADVIETPRADVYSRPMYKDLIAAYFAADDMAEVERRPPFVPPAAK